MRRTAHRPDSDYEDDPDVFRLPLGDRSLVGSTHEGRNFMFAVLRYVDMSEADFYSASFQYALLEGAIMERYDLRGAFFNNADMRGADLRHANLGLNNLWRHNELAWRRLERRRPSPCLS